MVNNAQKVLPGWFHQSFQNWIATSVFLYKEDEQTFKVDWMKRTSNGIKDCGNMLVNKVNTTILISNSTSIWDIVLYYEKIKT